MAKKFAAVMVEMVNDPETQSEIEREKKNVYRAIAIYRLRKQLGLTQKE